MLKLAKLLHHRGFHITFVNTDFNHNRFLRSRGPRSLDGLPDFRFEGFPDGLPVSDIDASQDIPALMESAMKNMLSPIHKLIARLNDTVNSKVPPVSFVVYDAFLPAACTAAEQLGIPTVAFFSLGACAVMGFLQYPVMKDKGIIPLKDVSNLTDGYLDTIVDWIPGMKDIRLRELPTFFMTTDPNDVALVFCMQAVEKCLKAETLVIHSFDSLEDDVVEALATMFPRVLTIGPLELLLKNISEEDPLKSVGYNLWQEESECLKWLDSHKPNSVVYINFGSIAVMTKEHLIEFGMGLANSGLPFLWIIRPDLVKGDSAIFPLEFLEASKDRGFIASWCPQEEVLNHTSIGGFLTHSGWNSTIESISAGVPMICWPFFADQPINCRYCCVEWGIGMEINKDVKRDEVNKLVIELMEGKKGKEMKMKIMELKKMAEQAAGSNGSSSINLDKLVNEVLSKC
jgi:hypothetical protein